MTAVLEETSVEVRSAGRRGSWAAVFALARFEARRLLLSIPVLLALAVYAAWIVWQTPDFENGYPALQDADRATQSTPLLVGLAVLVCANRAVLRSVRRDTERHFAVLVLPRSLRTAAHALAVVPVALLTAVGVLGQFGWAALSSGAVGSGSPGELLVGPLTVLLFGMLGVLVARLVPSLIAAPMFIVLLLVLFVGGGFPAGGGERGTRWLEPVVSVANSKALPSALMDRPAAWHALYLAGLALTVALLAVLAGGGCGWTLSGALAAAVALALTGGILQTGALPAATKAARERASVSPEKEQPCVRRGTSTYCAFPEWTPRADTWAGVVRDVQSGAGGAAHTQPLVVRQRIDARYGLDSDAAIEPSTTPHQVTVGTAWGGNRVPEFSAAVAAVLVAGDEKAAGSLCDGRMVTVMWLALNRLPDPMTSLRNVRLDDSVTGSAIVLSPTDPMNMTAGQTDVVRELLGRPAGSVATRVKAHWAELTAPKVTTARVAQLLGVTAPKAADKCE
ncbi:ABC transporter permease [Streptomyces sp. NPDC050534]|uniref:ABC transporter permease n=1 Tax=Streptomyces sp. NPDC050534 TaxID=3365625 RepID=UPI00378885C6